MQTLSYGIKKPQSGDQGSTLFSALEGNFQQQNDHSHNGTDSTLLTPSSLRPTTLAVASGSWSAVAGVTGLYRQSVTIPGGLQFDNVVVSHRDASSGAYYDLTVEKIDNTHYYVYINDNSLGLTAYFGL